MRISFFFLPILFFVFIADAQSLNVSGKVLVSKNNNAIPGASVLVKDSLSQSILSYSFTNESGVFFLKLKKAGLVNIHVSGVGYEGKVVPLQTGSVVKDTFWMDLKLLEKVVTLEEVFVRAESPIIVKGDTISIKTKYFSTGTEQTLEELLKKIPGISVSKQGVVQVGNKQIEKLMVEGDDFFGNQYTVMTKNMPAYPVEEVQVINRYSNNKLLKGIENSDRIALNLKLGEKFKRVWFGNVQGGVGNNSYHQGRLDVMNFGKKNKYVSFFGLNNIGESTNTEILLNNDDGNGSSEKGAIGDRHIVSNLSISNSNFGIDQERATFNNSQMPSLSAILNPSSRLKLKLLGTANFDKLKSFKNLNDVFTVNPNNFTSTENYSLRKNVFDATGTLDWTLDISKKQQVFGSIKYVNRVLRDNTEIEFNDTPLSERLKTHNSVFNSFVNFTNKVSDATAFLLSGKLIKEEKNQDYFVNQFYFQELFPNFSSDFNLVQRINNQMVFAAVRGLLLHKTKKGNIFELQAGNDFQSDSLESLLDIVSKTEDERLGDDYRNQIHFSTNDLFLKCSYRYKFNHRISIVPKFEAHYFTANYRNSDQYKRYSTPFVTTGISTVWELNRTNNILATYSFNKTISPIQDIANSYMLSGYRSLFKGTDSVKLLNASSFLLNYQLGNWASRFFVNASIVYIKNLDMVSFNSVIMPTYSKTNKMLVKNGGWLQYSFRADYFIKSILTNFKFNLGYSQTNTKNIINGSGIRKIKMEKYLYGFEIKSGFKDYFNFNVGSKWSDGTVRTDNQQKKMSNLMSFVDIFFDFKGSLNLTLKTERYYFSNLALQKSYYFSDVEATHSLKGEKLTIGATLKNILNTKIYREYYVSDLGFSNTEYKLIPRIFLLKFEYRF